jgi:hypothetical protein
MDQEVIEDWAAAIAGSPDHFRAWTVLWGTSITDSFQIDGVYLGQQGGGIKFPVAVWTGHIVAQLGYPGQ